jgi:serine/threonine protein kinase
MRLDRQLVVEALPNYDVGEEIGRGGWAIVLHARHRILDREVAVKQLPVAFGADPIVRKRFIEEARLVAKLDHPHIAPVYDFVERDGVCLILMEYLSGGSLWDRFQSVGVRPDEACAYILVVTSALEHAHEYGILHRDIKPENFLFDDRPGMIKLSDFGIAKVLGTSAAQLTAAGQIIGTPAYMAPEQILGQPVSAATDVYACATMLFELLTGELPFVTSDDAMSQLTVKLKQAPRRLTDVVPSMHPALDAVVAKATAAAPDDRYGTARAFGEALADAATQALGVGWLDASGVRLHAASHLVSITERASARPAEGLSSDEPRLATTLHDRIGPLLAEARQQIHAEDAAAALEAELIRVESTAPVAPASSTLGGVPADRVLVADRTPARTGTGTSAEAHGTAEPRGGADTHPTASEAAGWFPDPTERHDHRYWDGAAWTEHVADQGFASVDPLSTA